LKRIINIVISLILLQITLNAQTLEVTRFSLTNIQTTITVKGLKPGQTVVPVIIEGNNRKIVLTLKNKGSKADTNLTFSSSGNYFLKIKGTPQKIKLRILPGWLSIVPPLLAILLALLIREVLTSLLAGVFVGAFFMFDFNPLKAFLRMTDTIVINSLADHDHIVIIVFTLLFGAVIGVISKNGGTAGISKIVVKFAKSARSGLLASWFMGLVIFFDDYANSLIIGNMMRPITDKLRISREKLSYIVDSTAAPVSSLVIISSWIGFEVGLIEAGLRSIGSGQSPYGLFIATIPFRFYPIAAIFFVFLTSIMNRDFGPMFKAEKRARISGITQLNASMFNGAEDEFKSKISTKNAKWFNGVIPILVLIIGTIIGLIATGYSAISARGMSDYSLREIISNSDSFSSLLWASFGASAVAVFMSVQQKLLKLSEAIEAWNKGLQSMLFASVILVFAWSISSVTTELKTADYIISLLSQSLNPHLLPVLVFLICALISFATGTSWGTMAIVIPIVIPLAHKLALVNFLSPATAHLLLVGVVSSVLAGAVFGDHCSPIADTTILSSIASQCNHLDHVNTQLPYAIVVAIVCMLLGDIPTAYGLNPYISIILIFLALYLILKFVGKPLPTPKVVE